MSTESIRRLALLVLCLAAPAAQATCTVIPVGGTGTCSDVIKYLEDDIATNTIQFRVKLQDEANLSCTLTSGSELQISRTAAMFNERHQLLLLATATALPVVISVTRTGSNCTVGNVRIAPF